MSTTAPRSADRLVVEPGDFVRTGPGTLAGQYMRKFWQPVALLDDVAPGRAKPIQIMSEWFTLYRGTTGTPHVVGFRCAHRGTQMSTGWVEDDCLRCFYHGWKYDEQGQCVEQPAEEPGFANKVTIPAYPTQTYLGFVFAYFGSGDPPAFPRVGAFERPGHLVSFAVTRRTNYFNQIENNHDQVHINFAHGRSEFTASGINREIPELAADETAYGLRKSARYSDGKERVSYTLMPNGAFTTVYDTDAGWMPHLTWRVPHDDDSNTSFTVDLIELDGRALTRYLEAKRNRDALLAQLPSEDEVVDAILRGELHIDEVSERRPDIVYIQDTVALRAQPSIADRAPDRLGRSDVQLIALRKVWARELRAFAAGEPTKAWDWGVDLDAVHGA